MQLSDGRSGAGRVGAAAAAAAGEAEQDGCLVSGAVWSLNLSCLLSSRCYRWLHVGLAGRAEPRQNPGSSPLEFK